MAGYLSSLIVVRFRHLAIIMITLGFGLLLHEAANKAHWLTGGTDGLQGVRMRPILGLFRFDLWGYTAYTYSLIVLFVVFLAVRRIIHSPFGLSLRGIRENWTRMPAIGAPSLSHLRKVYTISAAIAGIAGALLAQTTETVSLEVAELRALGRYGRHPGAGRHRPALRRASSAPSSSWSRATSSPASIRSCGTSGSACLLVAVVMLLPNGVLGGLAQLTAALGEAAVTS